MRDETKKVIQQFLGKWLHIRINRLNGHPKEAPIPLVNKHGLKFVNFYELTKKVQDVPGSIVECGVGWGRSLYAFCLFQEVLGQDRHIFGFDSFQGLPDSTVEDQPDLYGNKKGQISTNKKSVIKHLINSGIAEHFIDSRVTLTKGFFEDTLELYNAGPIALLHLDVDLYGSYKTCLEYFYPLVSKGGIIAFDEYQEAGEDPGCRIAVDGYLKGKENILKSEVIDRHYIVKGA